MKHERDYISAGAYYRLSKVMLCKAETQISNALSLSSSETDKMHRVNNNWTRVETKIGFEDYALGENFDGDALCLFYGAHNIKPRSATDRLVLDKMKEILQEMVVQIDESISKGEPK